MERLWSLRNASSMDGGQIVCCDLCPVSVHPECIGYTMEEIGRTARWSCPHHSCHECGRKSATAGGCCFDNVAHAPTVKTIYRKVLRL